MILEIDKLDDKAKVWIYQGHRELKESELMAIRQDIFGFLEQWTSHNQTLFTYGDIYYNRFLVLFVDERFAGASGCSIDKSVQFIQHLENKYDIDFFGRTTVAYLDGSDQNTKVITIPLEELQSSVAQGIMNENTLVFDNLVKDKEAFVAQWIKPIHMSWHKRFI